MMWTASALGALHGPPSIRSHRVAAPALSLAADCFASELAAARRASREIRELLADASHPEEVELLIAQAQQVAEVELTNEGANYRGGTWVTHLDEHVFSIALVDREHGPVVGVVRRRATDETISASKNDGAWLASGDDDADGLSQEARAGRCRRCPRSAPRAAGGARRHACVAPAREPARAGAARAERLVPRARRRARLDRARDAGDGAARARLLLLRGPLRARRRPRRRARDAARRARRQPAGAADAARAALRVRGAPRRGGRRPSDARRPGLDFSLDVSGENSAAFAAPRHDRGLLATEGESINFFKRFTRSAFEDAAAGLEFWEADLRRHTGAPPGGDGGGAAERMRARLSKLMGNDERNS